MTDVASPELRRLIEEDDRSTLRLLIRVKPDGPLDAKRIADAIKAILERAEVRRE